MTIIVFVQTHLLHHHQTDHSRDSFSSDAFQARMSPNHLSFESFNNAIALARFRKTSNLIRPRGNHISRGPDPRPSCEIIPLPMMQTTIAKIEHRQNRIPFARTAAISLPTPRSRQSASLLYRAGRQTTTATAKREKADRARSSRRAVLYAIGKQRGVAQRKPRLSGRSGPKDRRETG